MQKKLKDIQSKSQKWNCRVNLVAAWLDYHDGSAYKPKKVSLDTNLLKEENP